jgi:valyl-tRNA synthetase
VLFDEEKVEIGRNFVNKIWQASRMTMAALESDSGVDLFEERPPEEENSGSGHPFAEAWFAAHGSRLVFEPELTWEDRWILSALSRSVVDVDSSLDSWRLNEATIRMYEFIWHEFCDWYLELAKIRLYGEGDRRTVLSVLLYVLGESLKLIHPLMPYVTEEIWDILPMTRGLVLENDYPVENPALVDESADSLMEVFQAVVTSTRNIRAQYHVEPGVRIALRIKTPADGDGGIEDTLEGIRQLAKADQVEIGPDVLKEKGSASTPIGRYEVVVPLAGIVDLDAETRRLETERAKIEQELERVGNKLGNEKFITRAKPEVVQKERDKKEKLESELEKLLESLLIIRTD